MQGDGEGTNMHENETFFPVIFAKKIFNNLLLFYEKWSDLENQTNYTCYAMTM